MKEQIFTTKALGTSWWIEIFDALRDERRQVIYDDLVSFILSFENNYSRFKTDSLLSTLNDKKQLADAPAELIEMLKIGTELYNTTQGVFNLLVGEKLIQSGYDKDYSFVSTTEPVSIPNPNEVIVINGQNITLESGVIDLGGIGKGYLIDLVAQRLKQNHGLQFFFN